MEIGERKTDQKIKRPSKEHSSHKSDMLQPCRGLFQFIESSTFMILIAGANRIFVVIRD